VVTGGTTEVASYSEASLCRCGSVVRLGLGVRLREVARRFAAGAVEAEVVAACSPADGCIGCTGCSLLLMLLSRFKYSFISSSASAGVLQTTGGGGRQTTDEDADAFSKRTRPPMNLLTTGTQVAGGGRVGPVVVFGGWSVAYEPGDNLAMGVGPWRVWACWPCGGNHCGCELCTAACNSTCPARPTHTTCSSRLTQHVPPDSHNRSLTALTMHAYDVRGDVCLAVSVCLW
jgi:hypothetical protein